MRNALVGLLLASGALASPAAEAPPLLLGPTFPLELVISHPAALLHWMDSLAGLDGPGMTAGKTRPAHLLEYRETIGEPTREDAMVLRDFAEARRAFAADPDGDVQALTRAFFDAATVEQALERALPLLPFDRRAPFAAAVSAFAPRYAAVWRDGEVVRGFARRVARDRKRARLARFLVDVARFFDVPAKWDPAPRLVLAPVRDGYGTHAQAIDSQLLIEIRPGEGLRDEVAPIVHETAHFLFWRIDPERLAALDRAVRAWGPRAVEAASALHEALPTAIAQGVADSRFRRGRWSLDAPWYHVETIDRYAKRLYPLVRSSLDDGATFDEEFLRAALALYPVTPR